MPTITRTIAPTSTADQVDSTSLAYDRMIDAWRLVRALWGGTFTMRRAAETYLPREPKESTLAYNNRLARSVLFNAFKKTVKSLVGKPFGKKPVLSEDVPPQIAEWLEDADRNGRDWVTYGRDWFEDAMQAGISHTLVDFPTVPENVTGQPLSAAAERAADIRPYFVHVKAEQLIAWRWATINGRKTLTHIRIRETLIEDVGQFGEKEIEQIRVIERDSWSIWQSTDGKQWKQVRSGINTLGEIPLVTLYCARQNFMEGEPPLLDLAHLNVLHWQSSSDQQNILHVARVPLLFAKNLVPRDPGGLPAGGKEMEIGPNRMIEGGENSDLKFVEHSGKAIGAGREDLADLEDRMVVMGLELQVRKPGVQTATQKIIDTEESDSDLHTMVGNLKMSMENAIDFMAKWGKVSSDGKSGSVTYNTDFGITMRDATDIDALIKARQAREISRQTFLSELVRRGFLDQNFDIEAETEILDEEDTLEAQHAMDLARAAPEPAPEPNE